MRVLLTPAVLNSSKHCGIINHTALTATPHNPASKRGIGLPGRRGLHLLVPALILLGVCVFAWGLRYKLSFYSHPHSIQRKMAEAKLLLTERSTLPVVAVGKTSHRIAPLAISLWVPALLLIAAMKFSFGREWALEHGPSPVSRGWSRSAPAFIRPPPRS